MAITREKKAALIKELTDIAAGALSMVFVHFKGLSIAEQDEVRSTLKKEGIRFRVAKKSLLKHALKDAGVTGNEPTLDGEVAFAYLPAKADLPEGGDTSATARSLNEFVKRFKEKLAFLGGVMERRFITKAETETYAAIPAMPVLRGMFVNIINSPIQRFAVALSEVAKKKG